MSAGSAENDRTAMSGQPAAPATTTVLHESLLDRLVAATRARGGQPVPAEPTTTGAAGRDVESVRPLSPHWQRFLAEGSAAEALCLWFGWSSVSDMPDDWPQIARRLGHDIAQLDQLLSDQLNAILHHPRFQKLEASWRGLHYLAEQADAADDVQIRVWGVTWKELERDLRGAVDFDQSQLFQKVYTEEFDTPGGTPFGVLIGDYEIQHCPSTDHPTDDVTLLRGISQVAAASFTPFIAGVRPAMFGLNEFTGLGQPLNISKTFSQTEYVKWNAFRESEDARFVGLTLPQILMRTPHEDDGSRVDDFCFREDVGSAWKGGGPDLKKYLWGNAAYGFASVLIRAFDDSRWLADIGGVQRGINAGGLVSGLPVHCFSTDKQGVAPKCSTDVIVTDFQEQELGDLGFIPLCHCADTEYSAFYTTQSVQKPKQYDDLSATTNARISAMLQYMLCVSQFAHYIKIIGRDKVGTFLDAAELEDFLYRWLQKYVTADQDASPEVKAELPLREARVEVRSIPGKPGCYQCVAHLWPHFELDELATAVRVATELSPASPG